MSGAVLYLSYDGILEPLGQSQVLKYLERLASDRRIVLVSYEKPSDWEQLYLRERLQMQIGAAGILWIPLRYHKSPSAVATAYDIARGIAVGAWAVARHRVAIVHARSYVPSVIALALKKLFGLRFVFDMRGFWADERVDADLWPAGGRMYRLAKWFERRFLLNADYVVSLTQSAIDEMRTFPYLQDKMPRFQRITTCADLDLFRPAEPVPASLEAARAFTLGYVGSVGVWYLFDDVLRAFRLLRDALPGARLHILNRGGHDFIRQRLAAMGIDPADVRLESADHAGVAMAMRQMDAGIFFCKPAYSKMASAPTRLGEFLGCGVPCLGNDRVGDTASILAREKVGVVVSRFDEPALREAIDRLLLLARQSGIRELCRDTALRLFALERGVAGYRAIYSDLDAECA